MFPLCWVTALFFFCADKSLMVIFRNQSKIVSVSDVCFSSDCGNSMIQRVPPHIPLLSGYLSSVTLPTHTESDMTQPVSALTRGSVPVVAVLTLPLIQNIKQGRASTRNQCRHYQA